MAKPIVRLILWFIAFGVSYLISNGNENNEWAMDCSILIMAIIGFCGGLSVLGVPSRMERWYVAREIIVYYVAFVALTFIGSYVLSLIIPVDMFVAMEILLFGRCIFSGNISSSNESKKRKTPTQFGL